MARSLAAVDSEKAVWASRQNREADQRIDTRRRKQNDGKHWHQGSTHRRSRSWNGMGRQSSSSTSVHLVNLAFSSSDEAAPRAKQSSGWSNAVKIFVYGVPCICASTVVAHHAFARRICIFPSSWIPQWSTNHGPGGGRRGPSSLLATSVAMPDPTRRSAQTTPQSTHINDTMA